MSNFISFYLFPRGYFRAMLCSFSLLQFWGKFYCLISRFLRVLWVLLVVKYNGQSGIIICAFVMQYIKIVIPSIISIPTFTIFTLPLWFFLICIVNTLFYSICVNSALRIYGQWGIQ